MNCAQVQEQLIDFLYGELPANARSAFSEHLHGCPACQTEVASYQRTLGSARAALGGPLLEEAPARVHLAVMAAASAAAKQATPTQAKTSSAQDELGFFARLWRAPWFLPACGAASIATVVFLVRVLKNPEVLPGQRPHAIDERALSLPAPIPPPEPTMAPKPAAAVEATDKFDEAKGMDTVGRAHKHLTGKRQKASEEMQGLGGLRLDKGGASTGAQRQFAEPPPPRPTVKSSKDIDDLLGAFKETEGAYAQPPAAPAGGNLDRARGEDDRFGGKAEKAAKPAKKMLQNEPAADLAKPARRAPARSAGVPTESLAPVPVHAPSPAAAPAAPRMRDYPAESAAGAPPSATPPVVKRKAGIRSDEEAKGSVTVTDDDSPQETDNRRATSADKPGSTLEESIRKAERPYASKDWIAAAAAYRDLLNRFPGHKDASRWRDRLNESLVAEEQRQARLKKAKAKTTDVLDGSKL